MATQQSLEEYLNTNNTGEIDNICDFLNYCYLYSDVINFDEQNNEINQFVKFLENDDIVIYSLILKTNCKHLTDFFINKILSLKNTTNIILDQNIILPIIDTIYEILILLRYWYNNLSEDDKVKKKIVVGSEEIVRDVTTLMVILGRLENKNENYKDKLDNINILFTQRPFNNYSTNKTNNSTLVKNKINIYDYLFDLIRQISENLIIKILELQGLAKSNFFNVLYNKNHNPHISLILAYFRLVKIVDKRLDNIYLRLTEYYYKGILMFKNLPEKKDKTLIMLTLNDEKQKKTIYKNSNIIGKNSETNKDIIFKTNSNIQIDSTKIKTIRTISRLNLPANKYNSYPTTIYKIGEYLMDDVYKNNKILYLFSKKKENDVNFLSTKRDTLGYLFSSNIFILKSGNRKITLYFNLNENTLDELINTLKKFNIFQENENISILNYVEILGTSFKANYTSEDKIIDIPSENINFTWNNTFKSIILEINLTSEMPEMSNSIENIANESKNKEPCIKILASDKKLFWAFYIFMNLKFKNIKIHVSVEENNNLTLQNNLGVLDIDTNSQPFGPFPKVNSMFYLTNEEIFKKKITSLKIKIQWDNLPKNGFKEYYQDYNKNIDNKSFKVSISILNGKEWFPIREEERQIIDLFNEKNDSELNNETILDIDIHKLKLNEYNKFWQYIPYQTSTTTEGLIKIELISPDMAFGHNLYTEILSKSLIEKKDKAVKDTVNIELNYPYTPTIKKISIDYTSELDVNEKLTNELSIYKIHPFGYFKTLPIKSSHNKEDCNKSTDYLDISTISIELVDTISSIINLYFVIDETSVHLNQINFKIGYINNNKCVFLKENEILEDKTYSFTRSGTIKIKKPNINKTQNTYLENNYENSIWLEIWFFEKRYNLPTILGIYYNCIEVTRISKFDGKSLPPLSLKSFEDKELTNVEIFQPFKSYGGETEEDDEKMNKRIKNRLQIKNRCISVNDYVTFILENFNEIKYVEVIKQDPEIGNDSKDTKFPNKPGNVNIVVILNTNEYQENGRIFPEASQELLSRIKSKLNKYCSAFSNINIINPQYEELKVIIRIIFDDNLDENMYIKILNKEISKFISPWLYDKNVNVCISKKLSVIDFIIFLKSKNYIKHILSFNILKFYKNEITYTYGFNDIIYPNSFCSIFYSSNKHEIIVDNLADNRENDLSIGTAHIEEDLIINAIKKNNETDNNTNNKVVIKDTLNDYFIKFK